MPVFRTRVVAFLVAFSLVLPYVVRAEETATRQPVAWLAVRSYQRFEQRLREFAGLTQIPGLAAMVLGMLHFQFAGLRGVDQQRPFGLLLPSLPAAEQPDLVVVLPYADRTALLNALQSLFPQLTTSDGLLLLQGGSEPAFGRLDERAAVLLLSRTPDVLQGLDPVFPADLFGSSPSGPDLVFRADFDTARQQQAAWTAMLDSIAHARQAEWHAAKREATSAEEEAFLDAYFTLTDRQLRRFLSDVSRAEARLTFLPEGWSADLEARLRPESLTAAFFNRQLQHASQALHLFSRDAMAQYISTISPTAELRKDLVTLLHRGHRAVAAHVTAETAAPPAQQQPGARPERTPLLRFVEQWLAAEVVEVAAELRLQSDSKVELTGWIPIAAGSYQLNELLGALDRFLAASGHEVTITRNAAQHHGTALHRLDVSATGGSTETPDTVFLATQGDFLVFHAGASPGPVLPLLDRIRESAARPPPHTDTLMQLEFVPARVFAAALANGLSPAAPERAIIAQILQGSNEPLRIEVQAHNHAVVQRHVLPGPYIQGLARVIGQQLLEYVGETLLRR